VQQRAGVLQHDPRLAALGEQLGDEFAHPRVAPLEHRRVVVVAKVGVLQHPLQVADDGRGAQLRSTAGIRGWCMCRATANALSMPAMSTEVSSRNTGRCRPAATAALTVGSEPHRFGRPSTYSGSFPMIPFSPPDGLRRSVYLIGL
jgi:hypothetical protein